MSRYNKENYLKPRFELIILNSSDTVTSSPVDPGQNESDPYAPVEESWRDVLDELKKK